MRIDKIVSMRDRSGTSTIGILFAASALVISALTGGCITTDEARSQNASSAHVLKDINFSVPLNVQVARLPGVSMSKSGALRVRRALSPPLIVVDGTQMAIKHGDLSFLNPADVASIEVVKGPEAAFYGQLGISGVIEVTTKHEEAIRSR